VVGVNNSVVRPFSKRLNLKSPKDNEDFSGLLEPFVDDPKISHIKRMLWSKNARMI